MMVQQKPNRNPKVLKWFAAVSWTGVALGFAIQISAVFGADVFTAVIALFVIAVVAEVFSRSINLTPRPTRFDSEFWNGEPVPETNVLYRVMTPAGIYAVVCVLIMALYLHHFGEVKSGKIDPPSGISRLATPAEIRWNDAFEEFGIAGFVQFFLLPMAVVSAHLIERADISDGENITS